MMSVFHAGEQAVQARAGVQEMASRIGNMIHSMIPQAAQEFLLSQSFAVVSSVDAGGRVWASLLCGEPGFLQAIDARTMRINALPAPGDPLQENLKALTLSGQMGELGLLVIDLETRRRMRLNGKAFVSHQSSIYVHAEQVYSNCPKYIQKREFDSNTQSFRDLAAGVRQTQALGSEQQEWIRRADTFFIASAWKEGGADASHRGGRPGFIQVVDAHTLLWPDYSGNNMFNTLGNLAVNPLCGLLFIDFERGSTLQITGKAHIIWEPERRAEFTGAERLVEFQIDQILESTDATPLRWQFVEYSPFNPA